MADVLQLRQTAIEKLNQLSKEKLLDVMAFIDTLITSSPQPDSDSNTLPPPDAFVEYAGTWKFEQGELEDILQDIEQSRLMELEEQFDGLLD